MEFVSFAIKSGFSSTLSEDNTLIYTSVILIFPTINPPFSQKNRIYSEDPNRIVFFIISDGF